mmetsp:Transcript_12292/g.34094  ORF Transcript_12292/g.34094 Transcript_12292/m.34094 type:complete len:200 (+) Transcript_12292:1758-2357(+)
MVPSMAAAGWSRLVVWFWVPRWEPWSKKKRSNIVRACSTPPFPRHDRPRFVDCLPYRRWDRRIQFQHHLERDACEMLVNPHTVFRTRRPPHRHETDNVRTVCQTDPWPSAAWRASCSNVCGEEFQVVLPSLLIQHPSRCRASAAKCLFATRHATKRLEIVDAVSHKRHVQLEPVGRLTRWRQSKRLGFEEIAPKRVKWP